MPLYPRHHRALHDTGREDKWWQAKGIDAKAEAEKLWLKSHGNEQAAQSTSTTAESAPQQAQPIPANDEAGLMPHAAGMPAVAPPALPLTNSQGQPVPIHLRPDTTRLG